MLFYAFGGRVPSAKAPNDLAIYELALDMKMMPAQIRELAKKNPRDYNKLCLINEGRKLGRRQIAINNKLDSTYIVDL